MIPQRILGALFKEKDKQETINVIERTMDQNLTQRETKVPNI